MAISSSEPAPANDARRIKTQLSRDRRRSSPESPVVAVEGALSFGIGGQRVRAWASAASFETAL